MKLLFSESFEYEGSVLLQSSKLWKEYGNVLDSEITEEVSSDGHTSLRITSTSERSGFGFRSVPVTVTQGKKYIISADAFAVEGEAQIYIEFWNKNKRLTPVTIVTYCDSEWETQETAVIADSGAEYMTILLYMHGENEGTAYFDNIQIHESDEEPVKYISDTDKYYDPEKDIPLIEKNFPRLYFTPSEKETIIKKKDDGVLNYAGCSNKEITESIIGYADKFAEEKYFECSYYGGHVVRFDHPLTQPGYIPNPPKFISNSRYPYWTGMSSAIRARLQYLATAYLLTNDDKYAEKAIEMCMSLAKWNSWSDPTYGNGNACLDSGYLTFGVCMVYDFLYDRFTAEQRETIKEGIYRNGILKPLNEWRIGTDHNIQVVLTCGIAFAACALHGEYPETGDAINKALSYFSWYLDKRLTSNCHEGNMYTSLAMEYIMNAANAIKNVTGERSLFDHKYISDVLFKWMIAGGENTSGHFAPISDGNQSVGFFITASVLYKATKNSYAGYHLKRAKVFSRSLEGLLYGISDIDEKAPSQELQSVYLDKIGWGSMRTGWNKDDTTFVFTSSLSNLGHNHYDNNSFVISKNDEWIATDPGYQDYSQGNNRIYTIKDGHNTIFVDGESQNTLGNSLIKEHLTSGSFAYMTGSAEKSYKKPVLKKFDRSFVMVNHNTPYFIVKDDISSPKPHEFSWRVNISASKNVKADHEILPVNSDISSNTFEAETEKTSMRVTFASDKLLNVKYYQYKDTAGKLVDVTDGIADTEKEYLSVISVTDIDKASEHVTILENIDSESARGCKVHSSDNTDDIVLFGKKCGICYGDVSANGIENELFAAVFGINDNIFTKGYALTSGTGLEYKGKVLLESTSYISAAIFFEGDNGVISSSEKADIKLYIGENSNSVKLDNKLFAKDKDGYVYLTLEAGKYFVEII